MSINNGRFSKVTKVALVLHLLVRVLNIDLIYRLYMYIKSMVLNHYISKFDKCSTSCFGMCEEVTSLEFALNLIGLHCF